MPTHCSQLQSHTVVRSADCGFKVFSSKKRFCLRAGKCLFTTAKKTKHMYLDAFTDVCHTCNGLTDVQSSRSTETNITSYHTMTITFIYFFYVLIFLMLLEEKPSTDPRKLQVANLVLWLYPQCDHVVRSGTNTCKYFLLAVYNPSQSDPSFTNLLILVHVGVR